MNNYGPPRRFKVVNTETGEETPIMELFPSPQIGDFCGTFPGVNLDAKALKTHGKRFGSTGKTYQSTGRADSDGNEYFFGDVLCYLNPQMQRELLVVEYSGVEGIILRDIKDRLYRKISQALQYHVIGNRHIPFAELERRAAEKIEIHW